MPCPIRYASKQASRPQNFFEMAEIPKLDLSSYSFDYGEALDSEEKIIGTQTISVSEFQYTPEKTDSFVIDMDAFSSGINKDATNANANANANSRITPQKKLQRSLSRKGSQRLGDRKVNSNATLYDKDTVPAICSPKATVAGPCTLEKPAGMVVGPTDHSINPHIHHQITMTANNMSGTPTESKCMTRRNSFRRPSSSWALDPKRVLLFFATLSSMGTMLLIYFTLAINKQSADD
ncbi:hypothetical protein CR513_54220, partial [Mucuna pruriens]